MSQRQVVQGKESVTKSLFRTFSFCTVFETYQKARTQFVQTVSELASRPQNIESLQNNGVMQLLRPLLLDIVPTIQQTAALALGRLANYNDDLAEAVVKGDILPQLVYSLAEQNVSWEQSIIYNAPSLKVYVLINGDIMFFNNWPCLYVCVEVL